MEKGKKWGTFHHPQINAGIPSVISYTVWWYMCNYIIQPRVIFFLLNRFLLLYADYGTSYAYRNKKFPHSQLLFFYVLSCVISIYLRVCWEFSFLLKYIVMPSIPLHIHYCIIWVIEEGWEEMEKIVTEYYFLWVLKYVLTNKSYEWWKCGRICCHLWRTECWGLHYDWSDKI